MSWRAPVAVLSALASGCGAASGYTPEVVAVGELTLRYDDGMQIYAGRQLLTEGPRYEGLEHHVRCVPQARYHAREATRDGRAYRGLAWAGGSLGVMSLGGLGGLALLEDDRSAAIGIIGAGVGVAVIGLVLAGTSRSFGNRAHGNAVDALNYYNDAVGSYGGSCDNPPPVAPAGPDRQPTPLPRARPEGPVPAPGPTPAATPAEPKAWSEMEPATVGTVDEIPR